MTPHGLSLASDQEEIDYCKSGGESWASEIPHVLGVISTFSQF